MVRMPGPSVDKPNTYPFGTPYAQMLEELKDKDKKLYTANGILEMLSRNSNIKSAPQRWQDKHDTFKVIFTCEERCFDALCNNLYENTEGTHLVHIINVDIKDNHQDAQIGGQCILKLAQGIQASENIDEDIPETIAKVSQEFPSLPMLYTVQFQ